MLLDGMASHRGFLPIQNRFFNLWKVVAGLIWLWMVLYGLDGSCLFHTVVVGFVPICGLCFSSILS